jgi:hypothetical protein
MNTVMQAAYREGLLHNILMEITRIEEATGEFPVALLRAYAQQQGISYVDLCINLGLVPSP